MVSTPRPMWYKLVTADGISSQLEPLHFLADRIHRVMRTHYILVSFNDDISDKDLPQARTYEFSGYEKAELAGRTVGDTYIYREVIK